MNSDPLTTAVMVKESMLKPLETTHSQMNCTPSPNPPPDPSPELLIEMSKKLSSTRVSVGTRTVFRQAILMLFFRDLFRRSGCVHVWCCVHLQRVHGGNENAL